MSSSNQPKLTSTTQSFLLSFFHFIHLTSLEQLRGGSGSALGRLDSAIAVDRFCKASVVNGIGMALAPDEFMKEAYGVSVVFVCVVLS